ncbi:DNA-binding protein [Dysgonomonas sp. 216]|uniref:helix-turn-helix domain-containing protein n=1 Tax=Dysgonomonas sp. 216 TaxID=2302934 RepID=UPI0013D32350|nr:helix-turn-helix domain-containing protein [Dysgonomonas sp. 216]NDW17968.1 DNA-binding protein [Dysgonomonas sp. 216]
MEIKVIEEKTFEYIKQKMEEFSQRIKSICKNKSFKDSWLDNQDVCRLLDISLRTLQNYRDKGILPYSQIGYKCYYKSSDIKAFIEKSKKSTSK